MQNTPWLVLTMLGIGGYVIKLWIDDYRSQRAGISLAQALPGATPASIRTIVVAASGGLFIVAAETWGEHALGIASEQSNITALFAAYTLTAAVVEEIIFRGYIVIQKRGTSLLWTSVVAASLLFACLHPFLWKWEGGLPWVGGTLHWQGGLKGWFSTTAIFAGSLWFYFVRFSAANPTRSLLPCFAAHGAKNFGVILTKAALGFLNGWY